MTFLANKAQIEEMLNAGYPIRQIQKDIPALANISYPMLSNYIQRFVKNKEKIVGGRPDISSPISNGSADHALPEMQTSQKNQALPSSLEAAPAHKPHEPLQLKKTGKTRRFEFDPNRGNELRKILEDE